jgi:dipeptidase E
MLILGSLGFTEPLNRSKLRDLIENKTGNMLIIPLACMFGLDIGTKERNCAAMAGFDKNKIYIFSEEEPEKYLNMKFDYIVVPGGNTCQLLYLVKKFRLDEFIRKQVSDGAVYIGFSAGAYLACDDIEYVSNYDSNDLISDGDFKGLGLTDKYVLCHFNHRGNKDIMMCRRYIGTEVELITINDDQYVVL